MLILAVDTTNNACSAAVYDGAKNCVVGYQYNEMPRGHAEHLPKMIKDAMSAANVQFNQLGKIVTTTGPGSFSGVRIGLSAAKGFAIALDIPLVGVGSLETVASGVDGFENNRILAAFDARHDQVYVQLFENGCAITQPDILSPQEAAQLVEKEFGDKVTIVVGSASHILLGLNANLELALSGQFPDARVAARVAAKVAAKIADRQDVKEMNQNSVHPIYLRRADAKAQKPLLNVQPSKVQLVIATSAYCEILAEIHRQGFVDHWSKDSIAASLQSPTTSGYIAVDDNQNPFGFIIVRDGAGEREILTIAVQINARRRKVASALLNRIIDDAKENKFEKIFLEVNTQNFSARSLYDSFGFEVCGARKNYYTSQDGQKQDAWVMSKTI